ncbi:MAG: cation transporter [Actinomycetaceae bacterium]|nr:cation transporter [Actinomycetaceae bacterium]
MQQVKQSFEAQNRQSVDSNKEPCCSQSERRADQEGNTDQARQQILRRRIRMIVAATIVYNIIEAIVALVAGNIASSSALIGFGLDSTIEVLSAAAVAWQFAGPDPHAREKIALRLIAVSFFGLAIFVTIDSLEALIGVTHADESLPGIILACFSVVVMPFLSWFERKTGQELGSLTAVADSKQTLLCTYLSAVLLIGLLANMWCGWTWADPVAGLVIAGIAVREGVNALQGKTCC